LFRQVGDVLGEANCILRLGDVAKQVGNLVDAKQRFETALRLYERLEAPYSIGLTQRRLARLCSGAERAQHLHAALAAWTRIDRPDLVAQLDKEFGTDA
jgi:hypothetical protein